MLFSEALSAAQSWAARGSILLALPLLISCDSVPTVEVVTETRTVEVQVEVVRPVPAQLTRAISYPPPLGDSITVEALIDRLFEMYDKLDQANQDRRAVKTITSQ